MFVSNRNATSTEDPTSGWLSKNCDENLCMHTLLGGDFELKILCMCGFSWTTNLLPVIITI